MFSAASLFLHAAALPAVVKFLVPRRRAPATEIAKRSIHPIELFSPRTELAHQIFRPQISVHEFKLPELPKMPEPVNPPLEKPLVATRRRSGSRSSNVIPVPSPLEPAEAPPAAPIPIPEPLPAPGTIQQTVTVIVNGQPFPIHIEATEARQQPVPGPAMVNRGEGAPVARPGELDATPVLIPRWRETADGYIFSLHDPTLTGEGYIEREYRFIRQENGDLVCRLDAHNDIIIRPDGSLTEYFSYLTRPRDTGLLYSVVNIFNLELDPPHTSHVIYREVEEATGPFRRRLTEEQDRSVMRTALDGLSLDLAETIKRHREWSLRKQREYLFVRWDECLEQGGGLEARSIIEQYIKQNYPQGTPREFSEQEIHDFNERRQTEGMSFCPYGCMPGMSLVEPQVGDSL